MGYTSLILRSIPIGGIISSAYNFGTYDDNFMDCAGYELSKVLYKHLYAVIGIQFGQTNGSGGTGTSHFRVPDCRGRFLCHTPNITTFPIGSTAEDILGHHIHQVWDNANDVQQLNANNNIAQSDHYSWDINNNPINTHWAYSSSTVGGSESRPKNAYVKYYIRYI